MAAAARDRRGGRDHIWLMAADEGACWMPKAVYDTSIVLTHWGRLDPEHKSNTAYLQVRCRRPWQLLFLLRATVPTGSGRGRLSDACDQGHVQQLKPSRARGWFHTVP